MDGPSKGGVYLQARLTCSAEETPLRRCHGLVQLRQLLAARAAMVRVSGENCMPLRTSQVVSTPVHERLAFGAVSRSVGRPAVAVAEAPSAGGNEKSRPPAESHPPHTLACPGGLNIPPLAVHAALLYFCDKPNSAWRLRRRPNLPSTRSALPPLVSARRDNLVLLSFSCKSKAAARLGL